MPNPNLPIAGNFNTYVGARYVPKFSEPIEWNQNTLYEPLTIVTYQGNSYTSRTFVPVGTDINNQIYWAQTGNYNAQVDQYRQEVEQLTNTVAEWKNEGCKFIFVKNNDNPEMINGVCVIGLTKKHTFMCDLSYGLNLPNIISSLTENSVKHIDYLFISHYHEDHANLPNLQQLINLKYIDSSTVFYLPLKSNNPTTWTPGLNTVYTNFINAIQAINGSIINPTSSLQLLIDDVIVTFANCNVSDIAYYDQSVTDYNNYSMVVYISYKDRVVGLMGDTYNTAHKRMYDTSQVKKCNLITAPHHGNSNFNSDFEISVFPGTAILCSCNSYLDRDNGQANLETSVLSSHGTKLYATNLDNIEYVLADKLQITLENQIKVKNSYLSVFNIYVNSANSGVGNGTSNLPFNSIGKALALANLFSQIRINIQGNNSDFSALSPMIINGFACELILTNMSLPSVRFQNMVVELNNCTFTSTTQFSLRFDKCKANVINVTLSGNTKNLSPNVGAGLVTNNATVIASLIVNNKACGISAFDCSNVRVSSLNVTDTNYGINVPECTSNVCTETLIGQPNSSWYTSNTIGGDGKIMRYTHVPLSVDTEVQSSIMRIHNIVQYLIEMDNLNLTSNTTVLGTINNAIYIPQTAIETICFLSGAGFTGTYYTGLLRIKMNGEIELITKDYENVKYLNTSVSYIIA